MKIYPPTFNVHCHNVIGKDSFVIEAINSKDNMRYTFYTESEVGMKRKVNELQKYNYTMITVWSGKVIIKKELLSKYIKEESQWQSVK